MWLRREAREEGQCFPHTSGSFLSSPSGSHTFLVARGELSWAQSGRYIPAASTHPLIIVIEGDAPAFVTVLNGRLSALPFSQLLIGALLV